MDLKKHPLRHHNHPVKRATYSFFIVAAIMLTGTLGLHFIERLSYLDAFYFMSLIATGQGPAPGVILTTAGGKLFTCLMAFISVGTIIVSIGYIFGPFFGKLGRMGVLKLDEEIEHLKHKK